MNSEEEVVKSDTIKSTREIHSTINTKQLFNLRTTKGQIFFLIVTVITSFIFQYFTKSLIYDIIPQSIYSHTSFKNDSKTQINPETQNMLFMKKARPKYTVYGKGNSDIYLKHVHAVLDRLGFQEGNIEDDWDLLWSHDYPFRVFTHKLKTLKPHQMVNHLPGTGFITNKVDLSTTNLPYIPKAFRLPKDKKKFIEYIQKNQNKIFVQKHNQHRHIQIKSIEEIDFTSNDTFIQEFVDNPYLVDGYKFDIGVYVTITSIEPLRIYMHERDVLFRYCPVKYYPFDPKIVDKYIVGDDYLPTWEVPALTRFYVHHKLGMKDTFDAYVRSIGEDPKTIWDQVEDAVRISILAKENNIADILKNYKTKRNFFEMMRFDLVVDANLKVYLMEANMSPNLSSAHFKPNRLLYEQVIYDLFNLVGIGSPIYKESLKKVSPEVESMISSDKNIVVEGHKCSQEPCSITCAPVECILCWSCLNNNDLTTLHQAYREHMQKGGNKRIFPKPILNITVYDIEKEIKDLSQQNAFMTKWFYGKCKMHASWCF